MAGTQYEPGVRQAGSTSAADGRRSARHRPRERRVVRHVQRGRRVSLRVQVHHHDARTVLRERRPGSRSSSSCRTPALLVAIVVVPVRAAAAATAGRSPLPRTPIAASAARAIGVSPGSGAISGTTTGLVPRVSAKSGLWFSVPMDHTSPGISMPPTSDLPLVHLNASRFTARPTRPAQTPHPSHRADLRAAMLAGFHQRFFRPAQTPRAQPRRAGGLCTLPVIAEPHLCPASSSEEPHDGSRRNDLTLPRAHNLGAARTDSPEYRACLFQFVGSSSPLDREHHSTWPHHADHQFREPVKWRHRPGRGHVSPQDNVLGPPAKHTGVGQPRAPPRTRTGTGSVAPSARAG